MNFRILIHVVTLIISLLIVPSLHAQNELYPDFIKSLDSVQAIFNQSPNYHQVEPVKQHDVNYQFAFRKDQYDGEIRIALFPFPVAYSEESQSKQLFITMTSTVLLNISHPPDGKLKGAFNMFPAEGVQKEYQADYGMTGLVEAHSDFAKGYKYANVVAIWKKKVGFIYIIILFNDLKKSTPFPLDVFYCTKFKEALPTSSSNNSDSQLKTEFRGVNFSPKKTLSLDNVISINLPMNSIERKMEHQKYKYNMYSYTYSCNNHTPCFTYLLVISVIPEKIMDYDAVVNETLKNGFGAGEKKEMKFDFLNQSGAEKNILYFGSNIVSGNSFEGIYYNKEAKSTIRVSSSLIFTEKFIDEEWKNLLLNVIDIYKSVKLLR